MIEIGTWAAVAVLGFGSVGIFVWFLTDLRSIMGSRNGPARRRKKGDDDG